MQMHAASLHSLQADAETAVKGLAAEAAAVARAEQGGRERRGWGRSRESERGRERGAGAGDERMERDKRNRRKKKEKKNNRNQKHSHCHTSSLCLPPSCPLLLPARGALPLPAVLPTLKAAMLAIRAMAAYIPGDELDHSSAGEEWRRRRRALPCPLPATAHSLTLPPCPSAGAVRAAAQTTRCGSPSQCCRPSRTSATEWWAPAVARSACCRRSDPADHASSHALLLLAAAADLAGENVCGAGRKVAPRECRRCKGTGHYVIAPTV